MAVLPPLITEEGLVLNNMMPGEGALGNYTPKGTASSEGISLMLRGIVRAAIATGDTAKTAFAHFLFDAACEYFFRGVRPTNQVGQEWHHSWIVNGGAPFAVRGPLDPSGDLALSGYIYGRNVEATVVFTAGVGQLNPPPDITYQAVTGEALFVWDNVFSDLTQGVRLEVDYYIDAKGNKIFGTQKGGSFGQPSIPAGQHTDGNPGKIVLKTPSSGTFGVNYCVTVPDVKVAYGELYEAWPMWRKLAENEVSTAADAIHWFLDAFTLGMELEPMNADWKNAHDRMLEVWQLTCAQESNNTRIFQAGANGPYNNFPLTYGYAYGRDNIDDPESNWDAVPPSDKFQAFRNPEGFVVYRLPAENGARGSGQSIRYGTAFENNPLFLTYVSASRIRMNMRSTVEQIVTVTITDDDGISHDASVLISSFSEPQEIGMNQFRQFQQEPGDATGDKTGDWSDDSEYQIPEITPVPFPGFRMALLGDSITEYNTGYYPPNPQSGRFAYYAQSMCGYFTYANALLGQRFLFEPGLDPDRSMNNSGRNWGVASSRVHDWWQEDFAPNTIPRKGPMWVAKTYSTEFDCAILMGGTNDLSGNYPVAQIVRDLVMAAAELAAMGKWVFVGAIPPRSRDLLAGYSPADQDMIRQRLIQVNTQVKKIVSDLPNIWFVDYYDDLLGPNGIDPIGTLSNDDGVTPSVAGNFSPLYGNLIAFHDGLHPGPLGAYIMGRKWAEVIVAAGVPVRTGSVGTDITPNPSLTFTQFNLPAPPQLSPNWSFVGWATGLGAETKNGNLHTGFNFGRMPDNIHFYRGTNQENQNIGATQTGNAGTYSNFMGYTWSAFTPQYPELLPYVTDSTWADGQVLVDIKTDAQGPYLEIKPNIPAGTDPSRRNQSFVVNCHIPIGLHGAWDNYGYQTPDQSPELPNNVYMAGDYLHARADIDWDFSEAQIHGARFIVNVLNVDNNNFNTTGAVISGIMNSHTFWPPTELPKMHMPKVIPVMAFKTPKVKVPAAVGGETRRYSQVKLEFAFDNYGVPVNGTIKIRNLRVYKN